MDELVVRLENIEDIEVMTLEEELGPSIIHEVPVPPGGSGTYNDFGLTAAAIVLGPPSLTALAVFLAKKNVKSLEEANIRIEVRPDGTVVMDLKTVSQRSSSAPPDAATVQALSKGLAQMVQDARSMVSSLQAGGQ